MGFKLGQDIIDFLRGKRCFSDFILYKYKNPLPQPSKKQKAQTYYVEILSDCNLQCALCAFSHREIFERKHGKMPKEKFLAILDKIQNESPGATVSPYHHCEPTLHPELPEYVAEIKKRGFNCLISMNFNYLNRLEDLLKSRPDTLEISVSGFYQETYSKAHIGGNIETVKQNMKILREVMDKLQIFPRVEVIYHMYKDNIDEDFDKMKEFTQGLGFVFFPCWSRSINTELSLKYLREKGFSKYKGKTLDWFDNLPPLKNVYLDTMEKRMLHVPQDYLNGKLEKIHINECPCNRRVVNIKWTGEIELCSWTFDDRFVVGDYLKTDLEELYKARNESLICKECLANNYALYTNYVDMDGLDKNISKKLGRELPADRINGGGNY